MLDKINQAGTVLQGSILNGFSLLGLNSTVSLWIVVTLTAACLFLLSYLAFFLVKRYILGTLERVVDKERSPWWKSILKHRVLVPLLYLIPAVIIYDSLPLLAIPPLNFATQIVKFGKTLTIIYIIFSITVAFSAFLNVIEERCRNLSFYYQKPVKGYVQISKIVLFILAGVLIIAELLGKSPFYLLTSIGALTAFILLVFKDTITSFVASVQIAADDLIRIGDWIESTQYGFNGEVVEMSLNNTKIQNFDKTVVTVPTYALLSSGIKNWRSVTDSGVRLIKRAVSIDVNSIKFCDAALLDKLNQYHLLSSEQLQQLQDKSANSFADYATNLRIFRGYLQNYLATHPKIRANMTVLVRHLAAGSTGLPIEIYLFADTSDWMAYEETQAEIFEHIFAILPHFDLYPFQYPAEPPLNIAAEKP